MHQYSQKVTLFLSNQTQFLTWLSWHFPWLCSLVSLYYNYFESIMYFNHIVVCFFAILILPNTVAVVYDIRKTQDGEC